MQKSNGLMEVKAH